MSIITRIRNAATGFLNASPLENPKYSLDDPALWDLLGGGRESEAGVRVTHRTAIGYPPLWRGINLISGDVARVSKPPVAAVGHVSPTTDNGKEKATAHPAYRLVRRKSSPILKAGAFRRTMCYHALIHGNGYAAIFRNRRFEPESLLLLDPRATFPAVVDGQLEDATTINGEPVRIPGRDVFHVKGLSYDGLVGHGNANGVQHHSPGSRRSRAPWVCIEVTRNNPEGVEQGIRRERHTLVERFQRSCSRWFR